MNTQYAEVNGVPHAYVTFTEDTLVSLHVIAGYDRLSGRPRVLGSAIQSFSRVDGQPVTLLNRGSDLFSLAGHLTTHEAISAIVTRGTERAS